MYVIQDVVSYRAYLWRVLNVVNSGLHGILFWGATVQLITVIRNNTSDDIMLWLLVGGILPSCILAAIIHLYQEKRYSHSRWIQESTEEEGSFMMVNNIRT